MVIVLGGGGVGDGLVLTQNVYRVWGRGILQSEAMFTSQKKASLEVKGEEGGEGMGLLVIMYPKIGGWGGGGRLGCLCLTHPVWWIILQLEASQQVPFGETDPSRGG